MTCCGARAYQKALAFSALIGVPVSLAAFWFLAGLYELEHLLRAELPAELGWDTPPWWWPLPLLTLTGIAVGLVVRRRPGAGSHVSAAGLHAPGLPLAPCRESSSRPWPACRWAPPSAPKPR